jgi:RNA polymerase sigma factor (sigma-70 family)
MLFEQGQTRCLLLGMVRRLTSERAWEEDLVQEALIHLWMREFEHPGQSRSWYIQSCRLYLQNYLRKGRSVDGGNHRRAASLPITEEEQKDPEPRVDDTLLSLVCARDLVAELSKWLTPVEKEVLNLSNGGLSAREIGDRLDLSHTSVIRHRRNIAALAARLGAVGLRIPGEGKAGSQGKRNLPSNAKNRYKANGEHTNHRERNHEQQSLPTFRTNC